MKPLSRSSRRKPVGSNVISILSANAGDDLPLLARVAKSSNKEQPESNIKLRILQKSVKVTVQAGYEQDRKSTNTLILRQWRAITDDKPGPWRFVRSTKGGSVAGFPRVLGPEDVP